MNGDSVLVHIMHINRPQNCVKIVVAVPKHHAVTMYEGVDVKLHAFLTSALDMCHNHSVLFTAVQISSAASNTMSVGPRAPVGKRTPAHQSVLNEVSRP
jgi:hypothetical protein